MPRRTSCCSRMKGVSVTPAAPSPARPRPWSGAGASGVKYEELSEHDWGVQRTTRFLNEKVVGGCVIGSQRRMECREFLVQSVLAILGPSACARAAPARLPGGAAGTSGAVAPAVCPARWRPRVTRLTAALLDLRDALPTRLTCPYVPPPGLWIDSP